MTGIFSTAWCGAFLLFEGNGEIRQYEGGYTDYVNRLAEEGRKPGEPVEFQEAAGRNASAAEGAQGDRRCDRDVRAECSRAGGFRDTWKREERSEIQL